MRFRLCRKAGRVDRFLLTEKSRCAKFETVGRETQQGDLAMTKRQAVAQFKEYVMPGIREAYEQDGRMDRVARREAWNNYTDMLCKDREISPRQYDTWTHPAICGG